LFITRLRESFLCSRNGWDAARDVPRCCAKPNQECCGSRLSARMVQFIHAVLRNALQMAVREEIVSRNVAKLVKVSAPKYKVNRGLTVDQARAVLEAAKSERLNALYVLALCLGLRRGELFGLRWDDVHLVPCEACDGEGGTPDGAECETCAGSGIESATLEAVQTVQRIAGELRLVPPKTDDSIRTVPLPELYITALCEHKIRQEAEREAAGKAWRDHGLVFPPSSARRWSRTTSTKPGAVHRPN
jgi:integrase